MAVERLPDPIKFMFWIKTQHHSCDVAPVRAFRIRLEQAQIRDEVFLIVDGQYGIGWCDIGDIGIERRLLHWLYRNWLLIENSALGSGHIDDARRSPLCPQEQTSPPGPVRSEKCQ